MEKSSTSASIGTRLAAKSRSQCARIFAAIASTSGHLRTRTVPLIEYHADISDPLLCSSPVGFWVHTSSLKFPACRTFCVMLVSAQGTATTKPFLAGPLSGVDEFDPAALALDRVGVFENRTPAHAGSSTFW